MSAHEQIRRRPGMYVGDTHDGSGRLQLLWEVVANAFDEYLAGHCDRIDVSIEADGAITVEDNGRGIRVDIVDGVPFVQKALVELHHGPTLDGHAPHEHLGLRGVGLCVVAALSERLRVDVFHVGRHYTQTYMRGEPVAPLADVGPSDRQGTRLGFVPDPLIFGDLPLMVDPIAMRLHELACLFPGLSFGLRDRREHLFHVPDGLLGLLRAIVSERGESPGADPYRHVNCTDGIQVEVIADWYGKQECIVESFANVLRTTEGGSHVSGLMRGLVDGVIAAMQGAAWEERRGQIEQVVSSGLRAIVCVRLDDPSYAAPTRDRLVMPGVVDVVSHCVAASFREYLSRRPEVLSRFVDALR